MTTSPNDVDPRTVLDLIEGFRRSKTMYAAVSLGVFDRLADGPADAFALTPTGSVDTMTRLLDACVALGLLRKEGERYENTEVAATYLSRSSPGTLAGYIGYSNTVLYPMWGHLEDAVREGNASLEADVRAGRRYFLAFLQNRNGFSRIPPGDAWIRGTEQSGGGDCVRPVSVPATGGSGRRHGAPCNGGGGAVSGDAGGGVRSADAWWSMHASLRRVRGSS